MDLREIIPVRPDLVAVTVSGPREAVDDWVDLLDGMPGWAPATTWATEYDDDLDTETICILMASDTATDLGPCPCPGTPPHTLATANRTNHRPQLLQ